MAHTKAAPADGIRRIVRATQPKKAIPESRHFCAGTGCHTIIRFAPKRKYCSKRCREITREDEVVNRRSTSYQPEYARNVDAWLDSFEGIKYKQVPTGEQKKVGRGKNAKVVDVCATVPYAHIPTIEQYAHHLGVTQQTVQNWASQFPAMREAVNKIKERKKIFLNTYGLTGVFNSKVTTLHLMSDHDMKERSEANDTHQVLAVVKQAYDKVDELEQQTLSAPGNDYEENGA